MEGVLKEKKLTQTFNAGIYLYFSNWEGSGRQGDNMVGYETTKMKMALVVGDVKSGFSLLCGERALS